jgi:hypothetical protein
MIYASMSIWRTIGDWIGQQIAYTIRATKSSRLNSDTRCSRSHSSHGKSRGKGKGKGEGKGKAMLRGKGKARRARILGRIAFQDKGSPVRMAINRVAILLTGQS